MTAETPTSSEQLEVVLAAAQSAARPFADLSPSSRAAALRAIADRLDDAAAELAPIAERESHLSQSRLSGELGRTTFQLRLFAQTLDDGAFLDARIDRSDPDWGMGPRPDLRRVNVPLGPAVVFAASNFPFAFSVAGGDTASALAAGCPVVLKAHPGHPELSARTGELVIKALAEVGAPDGVFAVIFGDEAGRTVLRDPRIQSGAFTGSIRGGRALFDIAVSREAPIPFFGELGSTNPVFVTEGAVLDDADAIVDGFIGSFTLGAGQFCTKPGLLFVPAGAGMEEKLAARFDADAGPGAAPLLNDRIVAGYRAGLERLVDSGLAAPLVLGDEAYSDAPTPTLLSTTLPDFLANPDLLAAECFGPAALVIAYDDVSELTKVLAKLGGQLTATLHARKDEPIAAELIRLMSDRAGRLLWGGWPTGVVVSYAQQHGGPYPATTAPATTSVGTAAIARFMRPVAYQNVPQALLPIALQDVNSWGVPQRINGRLEFPAEV
ncbi:aldehyde dehydrogenase (NADP(+)) [Saxibacter everestensis]|uniref:Aldehyde dehydrogenase (NADP(+)) n=1 Tax=Saxibacter everestensis TaxID=2909229 RepID=A0ABY8QQ80_9MICO|nr:aldehyde dehydrogenase (NADP(+)) [Brevibacteriaceae bacterium ZFBP1038]